MLKTFVGPATLPERRASGTDAFSRLLDPGQRWVRAAQLAAVILTGLLIRIAFIQSAGYRDDVVIFYGWFKSIAHLPLANVYAQTPGLNYPPMCVLLYKLEAFILHWFVPGEPTEYALNIAIKLPPILIDGIGALIAYGIVRRTARHGLALLAAAFIALNPAIIYDSAYWGQNDSIPTVLALFAISQLLFGNTPVAWLAITCAIFFKPPVLVLVPLMLLYPFTLHFSRRRAQLWGTAIGIAGAFVLVEVMAVTFFEHPTLLVATRHLIGQFVAFSHEFTFNSLNAFNTWAILQPFFVSDSTRILWITKHIWGDIIFATFAALIYVRYLRSREPAKLLEAAMLVLLAVFLSLTEMHERYLYYALFFFSVLVPKRPYLYGALVVSVTFLLNLEYGLTFMYLDDAKATMVDRYEFAPWLSNLCAAANVTVFLALLVNYLRPEPAEQAGRADADSASSGVGSAGFERAM